MFQIPALVPELLVRDFERSQDFYLRISGFQVQYARAENKFAMLSLERSWVMIEQVEAFHAVTDAEFVEQREWRTGALEYPFGRGINLQIIVSDVGSLYENMIKKLYPVKVPLEERWYRATDCEIGVRQFLVMDPDGYLLRFQQEIGIRESAVV